MPGTITSQAFFDGPDYFTSSFTDMTRRGLGENQTHHINISFDSS
jgi:hypothetical protein